MKKIRKAIIPAAGLGTRFLPVTKAMPKEMLPIVDKPTIQYIVEEAIASGIEDIIIVTGKGKRAIEDHFDHAFELEANLIEKEKFDLLVKVRVSSDIDIHYIRQKQPLGLGHAIWCARNFIGNEPFAVLLGDDVVQSETPCLKQLINQYNSTFSSVIGVMEVPDSEVHRYGVIDPISTDTPLMQVSKFIEKPSKEEAPSNFAIIGRYILTPEIFCFLEQKKAGKGGEIQLTDAIEELNTIQRVFAFRFEGKRYDVGNQMGFIETTIDFALNRDDLREDVKKFILEKAKQLSEQ
ncbi:UTP--glucose-1-phosphate uridylyltransferase GalU [Ureibacillus thermosphaericus]|uniref:UTP--glucose-1-phosphate uridylyltransferase n=1 Tax=Ureibacillus thermosphaericus TaxID=51173 RepID=A0A840PWI7_URETH|nr:UTP--glucose-1-phosphate uridylyltransferase GalU [Ureibacillus thermosphaericus]MBB5150357.1 UTP--glucose-1-phosphate uridylyltransferase [Ureibacillus thermosphaericus]NKZ32953.1 UTP--glucose-1-phosphate uridylyltransferase GalU [Ureibacillus thermosphaericus]